MGYWGHYIGGKAPTGQERVELVLEENGFHNRRAENNGTVWEVVDTAIRGSVVYCAIRITRDGKSTVYGEVNLTFWNDGYLMVKSMEETMGPAEDKCPKHILDKLSPTEHEFALDWRERCRKNLTKPELEKLPMGTRLKLKGKVQGEEVILTITKYRNRRAYVDWGHMWKFTPRNIRAYGYEIL